MRLDKQALREFQEIYKEEFGKEITESEAEEMGSKFLDLYLLLCKPTKKHDHGSR